MTLVGTNKPSSYTAWPASRFHTPFGVTLFGTSTARGYAAADATRLDRLYAETREQEWSEFRADCGKYLAELDQEEALGKFTLAELEEEEQSLDRLRRRYRDRRARDLLASPAATDAVSNLKLCQQQFEAYAEQVYRAVGSRPQD